MISLLLSRLPFKMYEAPEEVDQGTGFQVDQKLVGALAKESFGQTATYRNPAGLKKQIDKGKQWLVQLTDSCAVLFHPLVYVQSQRLDRLLIILWQLKGNAAGGADRQKGGKNATVS